MSFWVTKHFPGKEKTPFPGKGERDRYMSSEGSSESPYTSEEGDHEAVEQACEQIEALARSVKGLVLNSHAFSSSPSPSSPFPFPPKKGPVEKSIELLCDLRYRSLAAMKREANGAWIATDARIPSVGITKLARPFLQDMGHDVNKDVFDDLNRPPDDGISEWYSRSFSDKFKEVLRNLSTSGRSIVSYFHDIEMVLLESFQRFGYICVCVEMPIGSKANVLVFPRGEKESMPELNRVLGKHVSVCLVGCIDAIAVDMTTGEISVAEIKTKNLLRPGEGSLPRESQDLSRTGKGYHTCPRVTRPDLLQAWFYAHTLKKLYDVQVKNLLLMRTDVVHSEIAVTQTPYKHVDVWGEEHLSLDVFKYYMV